MLLAVFRCLDCEERLRAREVCTAFCAALNDTAFWDELDLRGLAKPPSAGMLLAASARAGGALRVLRLDARDFGHLNSYYEQGAEERASLLTDAALAEVLQRNADSLREVSLVGYHPRPTRHHFGDPLTPHPSLAFTGGLLAASPGLTRLDASLVCTPADACGVLLNTNAALQSEALHLCKLTVKELVESTHRGMVPGVHTEPLSGWRTLVPVDPEFAKTLEAMPADEASEEQDGTSAAWRVFAAALARADMRRIESLKVDLTRCTQLFTSLVGPISSLSTLKSLHLSFGYRMSSHGLVMSGLNHSSIPSFTKLFRDSQLREICLRSAGIDPSPKLLERAHQCR